MEEIVYDTSALMSLLKCGKRLANGFTRVFNIIEFPETVQIQKSQW